MITSCVFAAPRQMGLELMVASSVKSLVACTIDSLDFARTGRRMVGALAVADLTRLTDSLVDDAGSMAVELHGERDSEGHSWLALSVQGQVNLACQRCLEAVPFDVDVVARLELIPPGNPWPDEDLEDDASDAIEADQALRVDALVEDEIILALPLAPMHEDCALPGAAQAGHALSPFAALTSLKKH
jgi:uncharacterized protein